MRTPTMPSARQPSQAPRDRSNDPSQIPSPTSNLAMTKPDMQFFFKIRHPVDKSTLVSASTSMRSH